MPTMLAAIPLPRPTSRWRKGDAEAADPDPAHWVYDEDRCVYVNRRIGLECALIKGEAYLRPLLSKPYAKKRG